MTERGRMAVLVLASLAVTTALTWTSRRSGLIRRGSPPTAGSTSSIEKSLFARAMRGDTTDELTLVFLTSGACGACADERLPTLVEGAKEIIARKAKTAGFLFATIGVGIDATPRTGVGDLTRFGDFDEVLTGRGTTGIGGLTFMWNEYAGPPAVPQVIVIRRRFQIQNGRIGVAEPGRILGRFVGLPEIDRWSKAGYRVESK